MATLNLVLITTALLFSASTIAIPQKPVRPGPINTYFNAPPDTLAEMISSAGLVVVGRVIGAKPADHILVPGNVITMTNHRLKIEEVFAIAPGHSVQPDGTIDIVRKGGDRDKGSFIERSYQVGFPAFETGRRYLMFLVWNAALSAWVPAYGPDSVFDLTDPTRADSPGRAAVTEKLEQNTVEEVLRLVRNGGV